MAKYDAVNLILIDDTILFYNSFGGDWMPSILIADLGCFYFYGSLKVLHAWPHILPTVTVDKGTLLIT